jgi:hypothetical protein
MTFIIFEIHQGASNPQQHRRVPLAFSNLLDEGLLPRIIINEVRDKP